MKRLCSTRAIAPPVSGERARSSQRGRRSHRKRPKVAGAPAQGLRRSLQGAAPNYPGAHPVNRGACRASRRHGVAYHNAIRSGRTSLVRDIILPGQRGPSDVS